MLKMLLNLSRAAFIQNNKLIIWILSIITSYNMCAKFWKLALVLFLTECIFLSAIENSIEEIQNKDSLIIHTFGV